MQNDDQLHFPSLRDRYDIPRLTVETPLGLRIDEPLLAGQSRQQRAAELQAYNTLKVSIADAPAAEAVTRLQEHLDRLSVDSPIYGRVGARLQLAERALEREQRRAVLDEQHATQRLAARSPIQQATLELRIQRDQLRWDVEQRLFNTRIQGEEMRLSLLDAREPLELRYGTGDRLSRIDQPLRLTRSPPDEYTPLIRQRRQQPHVRLINKEDVAAKAAKIQYTAGAMLKLALLNAYKQAILYTGVRHVH